jgi:hypothetical protein
VAVAADAVEASPPRSSRRSARSSHSHPPPPPPLPPLVSLNENGGAYKRGERASLDTVRALLLFVDKQSNSNSNSSYTVRSLARTFSRGRTTVSKYLAWRRAQPLLSVHQLLPPTNNTNTNNASSFLPKRGYHHPAVAQRRTNKRSALTDQVLRDAIDKQPERYLDELASELRERANVTVSTSTVCRWLNHELHLPRKRASRVALARNTERVQQLRTTFTTLTQPRLPSAVWSFTMRR